jgi:F-type H+-transporting ATPase subunit delta
MPLSALATRYASALADVVTTGASAMPPQDAAGQLRSFEAALQLSLELRSALITPAVPLARKRAVVGRVAEILNLSRIARNFLMVLVDHRRIAALPKIIQRFEEVIDERLGFARAEVVSARDLTEPQRTALSAELERLSGKRVRMQFAVDGSLIGGVIARIGSTVYDGSVRGQLEALEQRLTADV